MAKKKTNTKTKTKKKTSSAKRTKPAYVDRGQLAGRLGVSADQSSMWAKRFGRPFRFIANPELDKLRKAGLSYSLRICVVSESDAQHIVKEYRAYKLQRNLASRQRLQVQRATRAREAADEKAAREIEAKSRKDRRAAERQLREEEENKRRAALQVKTETRNLLFDELNKEYASYRGSCNAVYQDQQEKTISVEADYQETQSALRDQYEREKRNLSNSAQDHLEQLKEDHEQKVSDLNKRIGET